MPDEALITQIENLLAEIVELGGQNERSAIVPNLTVQNANPANLTGFVIVSDDRDGDNILAKKVGSVIYSDNDLVNVMFLKGGEAIAFQQGSQSANNGIWEIVPSTTTDIFYDKGNVGISTSTPDFPLQIGNGANSIALTASGWNSAFIGPDTAAGRLILEGTAEADIITIHGGAGVDDKAMQYITESGLTRFRTLADDNSVLADILAMDHGTEQVGIGTTSPDAKLDVLDSAGAQLRLAHTDSSKFVDLTLDTNHDLTITPSSTGQVILQPTTDSTDFFQVLDADGGLPILNVDSTNERVGIGPVAPPEVDFHLSRDGSGTSFITEKYGGAPDMIARRANGSLAVPSAIGANVQLFGFGVRPWFNDTAAFSAASIGNFTFNSDEAISSTTKGTRFTVGTTENGNNSVTERLRINNVGDMGIGTTSPQGRLHTYETISGFIVWEYDGLDGTVRTVIPNGTGDVLYRLTAMYVLRDSAAAVASGTTDVSNGASVNLTVGGNTVRLRVNADGSVDVARTAGTDTIKVALLLRWL